MKQPFVRSPYNYDMAAVSQDTGLECKDPSLTQQQFTDECNINTIVEQFGLSPFGGMPENPLEIASVDFSEVGDYQTCLNAQIRAREAFMALPAPLRSRFQNDPHQLLQFIEDPGNRDEGVKLGLFQPRPPVDVSAAPVVPSPSGAPSAS